MADCVAALTEVASIGRQVSLGCSKYAVAALCYAAFPPCQTESQEMNGRRSRALAICRDDCQRLTNDACKTEYDFARRTTMRLGKILSILQLAIININVVSITIQ